MKQQKAFIAHYRYRTATNELCDHFDNLSAKSLAEAKRVAKGQVGCDENHTWLYSVTPQRESSDIEL